MINKKSIWFITLFSLVLVLSIYYVTMPNELLLTGNSVYTDKKSEDTKSVNKTNESKTKAEVTVETEESEIITSLRIEANEKYNTELEELKAVVADEKSSTTEKNNAFDKMKIINSNRGKEELLEKKILEKHKLTACVIINETNVNVTIASNEHDASLANEIMRLIQEEFDAKMYITVKFQK